MKSPIIYILLLFFGLPDYSFSQDIKFSRKAQVNILHKLDSIILKYEEYSSLLNNPQNSYIENSNLVKLFYDTSVVVFDDICFNNDLNSVDTIFERHKTVADYTKDIWKDYSTLTCNIYETDLGDALERVMKIDSFLIIPVTIKKELKGYSTEKFPTFYKTNSELKIYTILSDTINYDVGILSIDKIKKESTEWYSEPPEIPYKTIESVYFIVPSYSYLCCNDYVSNSFFLNDIVKGSFGLSAGINWRFVMSRNNNKSFGITTGFQGGIYKSSFNSDLYVGVNKQLDKDYDSYFHIDEIENFKENFEFYTIGLPLYIHKEKWNEKNMNMGRYFMIGGKINYFLPIKSQISFSKRNTTGYYPKYDLVMSNNEEYNFFEFTDQEIASSYEPEPINFSADISFGIMKRILNKKWISYYGLEISGNMLNFLTKPKGNPINSDYNRHNSILTEVKDGKLGYIGIRVGIRRANIYEIYTRNKHVKQIEPSELFNLK